jgi:general secretion pathway protein G
MRRADNSAQLRLGVTSLIILILSVQSISCGGWPFTPCNIGTPEGRARVELYSIQGALFLFKLDIGRFPSSSEGLNVLKTKPPTVEHWKGPYIKNIDIDKDIWGNLYVYRCPGRRGDYDLLSKGPDGIEGNKDDVIPK